MKNTLDTVKLLRFQFSFFLLPVSLFSFFYINQIMYSHLVLVIFIWHILVFPSSNGYNSYNDADDGPIGGLAKPPKPTKYLLHVTNAMDVIAIALSTLLGIRFAVFVGIYIVASRLYSYRKIRLKKYPVIGFLIVFIFQGAWIFYANIIALSTSSLLGNPSVLFSAIACSFLIATVYPVTQIYQHNADKADGVNTLSMMLGKKGTFVFSGFMFLLATLFIFLSFNSVNYINSFWLYNFIMLPATIYFLGWAYFSFKRDSLINFKNTMNMLVLSSFLSNVYFIILLIRK